MDYIKIYTSICGNNKENRKDITVFSDNPTDKFKLSVMNAKIYKVLPHKFISPKYSIYVDGNIFINIEAPKLIDEFLGDSDMALFKHPYRTCLYEEAEPAKGRLSKEYHGLIDEQVAKYRQEGMPCQFKLGECGMLIRKHNDATEEFNERWWAEICRYTNRDQMSFPYVLWKMRDRIKVSFIDGNVRSHPYFKYENNI